MPGSNYTMESTPSLDLRLTMPTSKPQSPEPRASADYAPGYSKLNEIIAQREARKANIPARIDTSQRLSHHRQVSLPQETRAGRKTGSIDASGRGEREGRDPPPDFVSERERDPNASMGPPAVGKPSSRSRGGNTPISGPGRKSTTVTNTYTITPPPTKTRPQGPPAADPSKKRPSPTPADTQEPAAWVPGSGPPPWVTGKGVPPSAPPSDAPSGGPPAWVPGSGPPPWVTGKGAPPAGPASDKKPLLGPSSDAPSGGPPAWVPGSGPPPWITSTTGSSEKSSFRGPPTAPPTGPASDAPSGGPPAWVPGSGPPPWVTGGDGGAKGAGDAGGWVPGSGPPPWAKTGEGPPGGGPPGPPGGWLSARMNKKQEILFNILVAFLQIVPQSCLTTVFPISRIVAESFNIRQASILPWVVAAYALSFGTFILIAGRLGDIFGSHRMVIIGFSLMSFWSVVAGLSHYTIYPIFFVARGFQGLGAALMVPNGLALLGRTYAPGSKKKIISFALFGLCGPLGAFMGFLFGAIFAQYTDWWWAFYALAIVSAILAVAARFVLIAPPQSPTQMKPWKEKVKDMDWLGAATGVGGLMLVQVALVSAPSKKWSTPWIYFVLIIGVLLVFFFVVVELRVSKQALMPFKSLKKDVGFVLAAVGCGWATFGIWSWFLWKTFLIIQRERPIQAALKVLPMLPSAVISSAVGGIMMKKLQPSFILFFALTAFTISCIFTAINTPTSPYWSWTLWSVILAPWGMNLSFPASTLIMSNFFPPHQQGVAGSLITTVVQYSISLGLGLSSTVEVNTNDSGRDLQAGITAGYYFGTGVGGLGMIISIAFVLRTIINARAAILRARQRPESTSREMKRRSVTLQATQALLSPGLEEKFPRGAPLYPPGRNNSSYIGDREGLLADTMSPTELNTAVTFGSSYSLHAGFRPGQMHSVPTWDREPINPVPAAARSTSQTYHHHRGDSFEVEENEPFMRSSSPPPQGPFARMEPRTRQSSSSHRRFGSLDRKNFRGGRNSPPPPALPKARTQSQSLVRRQSSDSVESADDNASQITALPPTSRQMMSPAPSTIYRGSMMGPAPSNGRGVSINISCMV